MALSKLVISKFKNFRVKIKRASLNRIETISIEKNLGLSRQIKTILDLYHKKGGLKPDLQMLKLMELYGLLLEFKPKSILEFGTGMTSAIIAMYQKNNSCYVMQIDENLEFAKTFKEISKIDSTLVIAERIFKLDGDTKNISYNVKIETHFDLAIIDGPDLTINGKKHTDAVCYDVINMVRAGFPPNIILVDGRDATAFRLSETNKYKLVHTSIRKIRFDRKKFHYWNKLVRELSQNTEESQIKSVVEQ